MGYSLWSRRVGLSLETKQQQDTLFKLFQCREASIGTSLEGCCEMGAV